MTNAIPAWYVVLVTTAAQMVVAMSNIVLSTIAPKVAESLGVAPVLVGYHVGLTFGAAAVASVYGGIIVRAAPQRSTMVPLLTEATAASLSARRPSLASIAGRSCCAGVPRSRPRSAWSRR